MRFLIIFGLLLLVLSSCGGDNAFQFLADEDSYEACRYKVTKDLDSGNYDAVLNSGCAGAMDKGAAYFGKAGFDVKDVINRLSEAEEETEPINLYMKALVPKVDETTLENLNNAVREYRNVPSGSTSYKDAQFYLSLVDAMKSLSLMKVVIDTDGDGQLFTGCDLNNNNVPDDVDATVCALEISGSQSINNNQCLNGEASYISTPSDITIQNKQGTYRGLTIQVASSSTSSCNNKYKKLLYKDNISGRYWVATTTSDLCNDNQSPSEQWPCPIEENDQPLDLVSAIDQPVQAMIDSINNALPGISEDVVDSIRKIRDEACGGDTCTSEEIANYLRKIRTGE